MLTTLSITSPPDTTQPTTLLPCRRHFPSADLVKSAAGLLTPHRPAGRVEWFGDGSELGASGEKTLELYGVDPRVQWSEIVQVEGPRCLVTLGPGVLSVRRFDPVRADRTAERLEDRKRRDADQLSLEMRMHWPACLNCSHDSCRTLRSVGRRAKSRGCITAWSSKSRSHMVEVLASLDYDPLFSDPARRSAMVTLTYPGDWETVAPDSATCRRHLLTLRKRYERAYSEPLRCVWKREFQRRGAPHYHLLATPPRSINGQSFREWLSNTWADIVNHPDPDERERHRISGTAVDYTEGGRMTDPRRLAVYFSKHGAYAAKEYQNHAPDLWVESGAVGRFWGVWGLDKALSTVEVTPYEALALARTMRRWSRANGYSAPRTVWRSRAGLVDQLRGDAPRRWRKRSVTRRVRRMTRDVGFLTMNDAPAFVSQVYRHLDAVHLAVTGDLRT